ncbi:VirB10/TraB/TrbI family type IV secretion system protein [Providencia rettgeri]
MSDETEKPLTAVEIEQQLKLARQQQESTATDEAVVTSEPKKVSLGIDKLRKSKKGTFLLILCLMLSVGALSLYYFPSLLRAFMSSDTEETPQETVPTGGNNKLTGLNNDIDPFGQAELNGSGEVTPQNTDNAGAATPPPPTRIEFSRGMDRGLSTRTGGNNGAATSSQHTTASNERTSTTQQVETVATSKTKITRLPYDPNLFIPENTAIPCALDRRFVSDLAGKLTCTVYEDVYSANGNVKLIDKGTVAHLVYKSAYVPNQGQGRVFLMATKLRTRTQPFIDIPLIDSEAAGALGETGVDGWVDTHFWDRFGGAMMLGMIPDAMQGLSNVAKDNKDSQTDYTANSRQAFAEIAKQSFANSVNIPPTLYKNQGEIISLITGNDLDFSGIYQLRMK